MAQVGKRTKLTPDVQRKIVEALREGHYFEVACEYAGIHPRTGMEWLQRGRGEHPTQSAAEIYVQFVHAVQKAQADDEVRTLARINQAGEGGAVIWRRTTIDKDGNPVVEERFSEPQWTADAWRLERKHTQRWGRKERIDVRHTIETLVKELDTIEGLTVEERTALVADIEAYAYGRS